MIAAYQLKSDRQFDLEYYQVSVWFKYKILLSHRNISSNYSINKLAKGNNNNF